VCGADDWVARAGRLFPGLTGTQHAITNVAVEPGDDPGTARVRASVRADHALVDEHGTRVFTLCGHYDDRCLRTVNGWVITVKRLVVEWTTGDPTVMDAARERAAAAPGGTR
jgi:SnoaL-like domain